MTTWKYRFALLLALSVGLLPLWAAQPDTAKGQNDYFQGKVVPLADALAKLGVKLDTDAPLVLALVTEDSKIYPLVRDAGARMFYQDPRLRNRPMRLTGKLLPGTGLLQVLNVHSYHQGKLHEVFYWCDICTIRGYQFVICDCCGGPMELREPPLNDKK